MKIQKCAVSLLVLAAITITRTSTYAEPMGGHGAGNGGDAVVLPDQTVVSADPYLNPNHFTSLIADRCRERGGQRQSIQGPVQDELTKAGKILSAYGLYELFGNSSQLAFESQFVNEAKNTAYCFVSELPGQDNDRAQYNLPNGLTVSGVAFTSDGLTYIKRSLFNQMAPREQAKVLLHERVHVVTPNATHLLQHHLSTGLTVALNIYDQQEAGQRPILTAQEITTLENMREAIKRIRIEHPMDGRHGATAVEFVGGSFRIVSGGGLADRSAMLSPDAYVGITSRIGWNARIGAATLIHTRLCTHYHGTLANGMIQANLAFDDAAFDPASLAVVKNGAQLKRTIIDNCVGSVEIDEHAKLEDVSIYGVFHSQFEQNRGLMQIAVGPGTHLNHIELKRVAQFDVGGLCQISNLRVNGHLTKIQSDDSRLSLVIDSRVQLSGLNLLPYLPHQDEDRLDPLYSIVIKRAAPIDRQIPVINERAALCARNQGLVLQSTRTEITTADELRQLCRVL